MDSNVWSGLYQTVLAVECVYCIKKNRTHDLFAGFCALAGSAAVLGAMRGVMTTTPKKLLLSHLFLSSMGSTLGCFCLAVAVTRSKNVIDKNNPSIARQLCIPIMLPLLLISWLKSYKHFSIKPYDENVIPPPPLFQPKDMMIVQVPAIFFILLTAAYSNYPASQWMLNGLLIFIINSAFKKFVGVRSPLMLSLVVYCFDRSLHN